LSSAHTHEVSPAHGHDPYLAEHFQTRHQQEDACTLGMWLFLAQEVMFFGGMFLAYSVYRALYPEAFHAGSASLNVSIGAFNTVVLLLSSFTMAMGVYFAQVGRSRALFWSLVATLLLGMVFVIVKWLFEYTPKFHDGVFPGNIDNGFFIPWGPHGHYGQLAAFPNQGQLQIFFWLYFVMSGMHALHMIIGFAIILVLMVMTLRGKFGPQRFMPILFFGLYWHFVDIVWVFLFPMYYLIA
jgi:cytochrome c oxidase subunit 3